MFSDDISNGNNYNMLIVSPCNGSSHKMVKIGNDKEMSQSEITILTYHHFCCSFFNISCMGIY